jgi:hypothetical protein
MNVAELRAEADVEFAHLDRVVAELVSLRRDVGEREPTLRELVAGGAFLTQFYNGVENVLKRISKHEGVPLPEGPDWHVELFLRFCTPSTRGLPALLDEQLRAELARFRGFRHVARTSYGTELDWKKVSVGIDRVVPTYARFREAIEHYLDSLC